MIHKIETDEVRVERIGNGSEFDTILENLSRSQSGGVAAPVAVTAKIEGIKALFLLLKHYNTQGVLIPAIKLVREITGLGLKEAKDTVEGW